VPAGPDGRPGERLLLPSLNAYDSGISRDGARHDCQAFLTRKGSLLLVVCLGRVSDRSDAWSSARHTIEAVTRIRTRSCVVSPEASDVAGMPAVHYALAQRNGETLYEWKFERDGWLYAAGILARPRDKKALAAGRLALNTWQWQSEVSTEPEPEIEKSVGLVLLTRTIDATPDHVWARLRTLEGQAALRRGLIDSFVVPPLSTDAGERFAFVYQQKNCRRTRLLEILSEEPLKQLVVWDPHTPDRHMRITYDLQDLPLRRHTNVTLSVQYSVAADASAAAAQRATANRTIDETLHRLQASAEQAARSVV